jgi:hypothetical protein
MEVFDMTINVKSKIESITVPCFRENTDYLKFYEFETHMCSVKMLEGDRSSYIVLSRSDAKALAEELLKWVES